MPYPVAAESAELAGTFSAFSKAIPDGHQADDLLLAFVWQDGGGTTIATATTGWAQLGTQAQEQAQRTACFYKRATSSAEADVAFTGAADDWAISLIVLRGVNWTNPINAQVRVSVTGISPVSSALTTTANNCLVIYALGYDGTMKLSPKNPSDLFFLTKSAVAQTVGPLVVGYRSQLVAGAAAQVEMMCAITLEGGSFWTIAIEDDGSGQMPPDCRQSYDVLKHHGYFSTQHDGITWGAPSAITGSPTIDGLGLDTTTPTTGLASTNPSNSWNYPMTLPVATNLGADAWAGGSYAISPAADLTGRLFGLRFGANNYSTPLGVKGFIVVFQDGAGAWVAFRLSQLAGINDPGGFSTYYSIIDVEAATPLASGGGSMDWSDVVRAAYCYHRVAGSAVARQLLIADAFLFSTAVLHGGSAAAPCSTASLDAVLSGWSDSKAAALQGVGQTLARVPFQLGNGTDATYVDESAKSLESPRAYGQSLARRLWQAGVDSTAFRIKASASDVIRVSGNVAATSIEQPIVIDAASSPSAIYDFSGFVASGWRVEHNAPGVTINDATFLACYQIALAGALQECSILRSVALSAVVTADPSEVSGCAFVSAGSGHALEITSPGAYTFAGNTFDGYGADGTTDAAVYNNSGGAVTLNITGGGDTPTVRNGAGASTTLNNNVTLTLEGVVVGSSIQVEIASSGALVEFRVAATTTEAFSVAAGVQYRVKVRKASATPFYRPWSTLTTPADDISIFVAQDLDE